MENDQDSELVTQSEDEMVVMKYLLIQYNLKAVFRHFGDKGIAAAKGNLTNYMLWTPGYAKTRPCYQELRN